MPAPDDLDQPPHATVALLHDLASLAAAIEADPPRRTHGGTLDRHSTRRLGRRLASDPIARTGRLEDDARWERAMRALEALGAISMHSSSRKIQLLPHLETTLRGAPAEAAQRLVQRLVDRDLHPLLAALREALRQAGEQAIDTVILLDLVAEQHRTVLVRPWVREGQRIYPLAEGEPVLPFDRESFDRIEAPSFHRVLSTAHHLGLLRRAPGVIAATEDGLIWARGDLGPRPPLWISSDLEIIVPPGSLSPWQRLAMERLCRCLARDVVDRYQLRRDGLQRWLASHELKDAFDLLEERCPALPETVRQTLHSWARSATRVVLTRGVLLDDTSPGELQ